MHQRPHIKNSDDLPLMMAERYDGVMFPEVFILVLLEFVRLLKFVALLIDELLVVMLVSFNLVVSDMFMLFKKFFQCERMLMVLLLKLSN